MFLYRLASWLKRGRRDAASHRDYSALKECDPRMLRDIGLYREHGRLLPLHPETSWHD
ncbi:DUF1127 domain-containing protein [Halomonas chromatireducens]|uniref:DUF1127 domain-containing protein n=1 Tax=Halomonas chromatireducens TaxID=507626 RepID=A0A120JVX8_9GAMM|nr:DUF1127 domain-containing protein [Halomonas chromatireducens]AMD00577.1 hypothetical protein LOKO_01509 [Halomonas chromatireducens]